MTQAAIAKMPFARIALLVAAVVAAFVVGVAVMRPGARSPAGEAAASAESAPPTIENLEKRTQAQPRDVSGWRMLGAAYFNETRFDEAARAYQKASALAPQTAAIWSALGEARVMASRTDPMPPAAVDAFNRAVALDAKDPRARYFLAVKRDLTGDHAGAVGDWLALLADTPADAPWRADLVRTIEQVGKINKIDVAPRIAAAQARSPAPTMPPAARGIPGPNAQDLAAAASIPPSQQRDMAEGMVSRLEGRLKSQPKDVDGWVMLMRSRMTLGQPDKARQALRDAIAANPGQADMLRQQAAILDVR
jgi:cytochrome c-type biogenesis protein CcmH